MNPIFQGLNQGYSPEELLGYLSKAIPAFSSPIKKAKGAGYTVNQILGFLSKNMPQENRKGMSESARHARNRENDAEMTKHGLKMVATAVAAPLAAQVTSRALARALPSSLISGGPQSPGSPTPSSPNVSYPSSSASVPTQQPNLEKTELSSPSSQPPISPTNVPETPDLKQAESLSLLTKFKGFTDKIDSLVKSGNGLDEITGYFKKFNPSQIKKLEKELGKPIEEIVTEYLGGTTNDKVSTNVPIQEQEPLEQPIEQLDVPQEVEGIEEVKAEPIQKSQTVSSPQGVGEVKEIRNGQAIVEVDGKKHKVPVEELEASPLPEKDLADLHDDLIKGIESEIGEDVSRMIQWLGYDPDNNILQFLPHTGKMYTYKDISPEDAAELKSILSTRKTSGSNFIGAWKEGSKSPAGVRFNALLKKIQSERGGKGKEYSGAAHTIYSAYEPAIQAKKKKKKS